MNKNGETTVSGPEIQIECGYDYVLSCWLKKKQVGESSKGR